MQWRMVKSTGNILMPSPLTAWPPEEAKFQWRMDPGQTR
jgi:hypothetical protein